MFRCLKLALLMSCFAFSHVQAGPIIICKVNHQGLLTDEVGAPLTGAFDITYRIYEEPVGGLPLWEETHLEVPVSAGFFNVILGEIDPIAPDVFVDPSGDGMVLRFLDIKVGADPSFSPRGQLVAAPYAIGAYRLAGDVRTMPGGLFIPDPLTTDALTSSAYMGAHVGQAGIILVDSRPGPNGTDSATAEITVNGEDGSSFRLENVREGTLPCFVKLNSRLGGAELNVVSIGPPGNNPPLGGGSSLTSADFFDSVAINLRTDTLGAILEIFAGVPSLVLRADTLGGRIGINSPTPQSALDVVGDICVTGSVGACSDLRYKKNVRPIEDALGKLAQIRGVDFEWRRDEFREMRFADGRHIGVVAQEVESVLPELVSTRDGEYKTVDYSKLTAVLIEAVKELKAENDKLKRRMELLESK